MAESRVRDGDKGIDLLVSRVGQVLQANRFVVEFTKLKESGCSIKRSVSLNIDLLLIEKT